MTNESTRFYVIATMWVQDCDIPRFEAYERKAISIAQRHSGRLERVIRVTKDAGKTDEAPIEVHVLSFSSDVQFANYRIDPELVALSDERARVISKTEVLCGTSAPAYPTKQAVAAYRDTVSRARPRRAISLCAYGALDRATRGR